LQRQLQVIFRKPQSDHALEAEGEPMDRNIDERDHVGDGDRARRCDVPQTKRCNTISAGENPTAMPWRAATNPAAQNGAAPAPQAMPAAVAGMAGGERPDVKTFLNEGKPAPADR